MRAGRAAAINHATKNQNKQKPTTDEEMMAKYGLEKIKKDPQLKQFKQEPFQEPELTTEQKFGLKPQDGQFDHHAEIMRAKLQFEEQEKMEQMRQDLEAAAEDEEADDDQGIVREADQFRLKKNFEADADAYAYNAQLGIKQVDENRMVFRKLPISIWVAGLLIVVSSLYLIYHLALGQYGVLFEGYREGYWWQYFISLIIMTFGIVFMHAGKVEMVVIDKSRGILYKDNTSIFCRHKMQDWAIDQIQNVKVYKRGHDGIQVMTIHYELQFDFLECPSQPLIQTTNSEKALKLLAKVKQFLDLPISKNDFRITDETTSNYKKGQKYRG